MTSEEITKNSHGKIKMLQLVLPSTSPHMLGKIKAALFSKYISETEVCNYPFLMDLQVH